MKGFRPRLIAHPMDARQADEILNRRVRAALFLVVFALAWLTVGFFIGKASAARSPSEHGRTAPTVRAK